MIKKDVLLIQNLVALFLIINMYSIVKSLSGLFFALIIQLILFFITCKVDTSLSKYLLYGWIFGLLILSLVYIGYKDHNGIPYFTAAYNDDQKFEKYAVEYNLGNYNFISFKYNNFTHYNIQYAIYIQILSWFIDFGNLFDGYSTILPRLFNILLILLQMLFIYSSCNKLYNFNKTQNKVLLSFLAFFPNIYYLGSFVFRDTLCAFLVVLMFWGVIKLKEKKIYILLCLFDIFILFYLRELLAYFCLFILFILIFKESKSKVRFGLVIVFISIAFVMHENIYLLLMNGLGRAADFTENAISYNSMSMTSRIAGVPILPFGILFRMIYGFITPFSTIKELFISDETFFYTSIHFIVNIIGTLALLCCIPKITMSFKKFDIVNLMMCFMVIFFCCSFVFRHMLLVYPFVFICIARESGTFIKKETRQFSIIYIFIIIIFYLSINFLS